ncbi:U4 U6.U5 tri-snRNP-associated protein, partial [Coemansia sp. RSA 2618]
MAPLKRAIADDTGSEALKHLRIDDGQPIKAQAPQQNTDNLHSEPSDSESDQDMDAADHVADAYLDTVNRSSLDFDFEQLCSVSLATSNVYACLVCGKYYQGRGKQTHAYFHSINDDHHVFINLTTLAVYVLPENYEVADRSLNDIKD